MPSMNELNHKVCEHDHLRQNQLIIPLQRNTTGVRALPLLQPKSLKRKLDTTGRPAILMSSRGEQKN